VKILNLVQGSPPWLQARVHYRCASEAPIVMGASRFMSRQELVRMKATGGEKEFSDYVRKKVLEKGRDAEHAAMLFVQSKIGTELYPVTGIDRSGMYLASFDGVPMVGRAVEHKLWSVDLDDMIRLNDLSGEYFWQLEAQMIVSEDDEMLFIASDGTPEKCASMIYRSVPERRAQLRAGWDQFEKDVAEYHHVEALPEKLAPVATLPALSIRVEGSIALLSNLDVFGEQLHAFVDGLNLEPKEDDDFAAAEAAIKTLERAEAALKAAEDSALAQTASVDQMRRTVASYNELARTTRLMLGKLVVAKKTSRRAEIIQEGRDAFGKHILSLAARVGIAMPTILTDFPGSIKGKRTIQTMRDAVLGELSRAKLVANEVADHMQINLETLRRAGLPDEPDLATLVLKASDDLRAIIDQRIAKRLEALEAERVKIRAEEAEKLRLEAAQAPTPTSTSDQRPPVAAQPAVPVPAALQPALPGAAAVPATAPAPAPAPAPAAAWPFPTSDQLIDALSGLVMAVAAALDSPGDQDMQERAVRVALAEAGRVLAMAGKQKEAA
jgi:predicted phage-related endonuclease